ncbi:MAG: hypothetical protein QXT68_00790 [Halobacteria archaeon]
MRLLAGLERALYYTAEHYGLGLLEALGRPAPRLKLRTVRLLPLGAVDPKLLSRVERRLREEFGVALVREAASSDDGMVVRGAFFVPGALRALGGVRRREGEALLVVTPRPLTLLPPAGVVELLRGFYLLLGLAVPLQRVAFVTTLGGRLKPGRVAETAAHEVAHLKGVHGWPMYRS